MQSTSTSAGERQQQPEGAARLAPAASTRALALVSALAVGLAACGGRSAPQPGGPLLTDRSPGHHSAASAGSPASVASVAPTQSTAAIPASAPSPFHEYARFGAEVRLFPVGAVALLGGPSKEGMGSFALMVLSGSGELSRPDSVNRGVPRSFSELNHIAGTWPDATFASYVTGNGRVGWSQAMQLGRSGWRDQPANPPRWIDVGLSNWDRGRTLGLSLDVWGIERRPPTFRVLGGAPKKPVPGLTPYPGPAPTDGAPACTSLVIPEGFTATETGHVFVVGTECGKDKVALLEWFAPGKTKGAVLASPFGAASGALTGAVVSDSEIYLAFGGKLVLFDGNQFTPQSLEFSVIKLTRSQQGTLWASAGDSVWQKPKGTDWRQLTMPRGVEALDIFAPDDTQVFVGTGTALYALAAPSEVKQLDLEWAQQPARSFKLPTAARADCKQPYAMMYAFTKVTPDDYDFPLTRKAVKGQTWLEGTRFVVTEENGKKYFGALPTDYATGQKLVALIQKQVKGAMPALLCADPKVVRELPIDLNTGEVRR